MEINNAKSVVGVKQVLRAIEAGGVQKVIIASDAEEKITRNVREICRLKGIHTEYAENMKLLGRKYGISVGASVVALLAGESVLDA